MSLKARWINIYLALFFIMEKLTELIYNHDTDCLERYISVVPYLGCLLKESLQEIERFYYSEFW